MMDLTRLTDDQLINEIAALAVQYKERFGKNLGVTAEVGEHKAAKILGLKRAENNLQEGFDAEDRENKRVQIKTRIFLNKTQRTGVFSKHVYDYALLVLLSDKYELLEIYKAGKNTVDQALEAQSYSRPSLPIGKFMKIGKQIYP